jgi:MFS family permease
MPNLRRRIIVGTALLFTGKQAAAMAATTVAAAVTAVQIGADPIPWAIGAAASTVVYAYRTPATRSQALANGVICIFIGGVCAPWVGRIISEYHGAVWSNDYVLAGFMAAVWPWAAPIVWRRAVAIFDSMTDKGAKNG